MHWEKTADMLCRDNPDKWIKKVTDGNSMGRRKRGRPKEIDQILADVEPIEDICKCFQIENTVILKCTQESLWKIRSNKFLSP